MYRWQIPLLPALEANYVQRETSSSAPEGVHGDLMKRAKDDAYPYLSGADLVASLVALGFERRLQQCHAVA